MTTPATPKNMSAVLSILAYSPGECHGRKPRLLKKSMSRMKRLNQVLVRLANDHATTDQVIEAAALWRVLDRLDDLAWPEAHAHLSVKLAYYRG